jgi:hypothetical protein
MQYLILQCQAPIKKSVFINSKRKKGIFELQAVNKKINREHV